MLDELFKNSVWNQFKTDFEWKIVVEILVEKIVTHNLQHLNYSLDLDSILSKSINKKNPDRLTGTETFANDMSGLKLKITTKYSKRGRKKTDDKILPKKKPKKKLTYYVLHTLTPASWTGYLWKLDIYLFVSLT